MDIYAKVWVGILILRSSRHEVICALFRCCHSHYAVCRLYQNLGAGTAAALTVRPSKCPGRNNQPLFGLANSRGTEGFSRRILSSRTPADKACGPRAVPVSRASH